MFNSIDCSAMFTLPDPAEVDISTNMTESETEKGYTHKVLHNGSLIWLAKSEVEAMVARNGYIETGV
jgi:hypothetical protein